MNSYWLKAKKYFCEKHGVASPAEAVQLGLATVEEWASLLADARTGSPAFRGIPFKAKQAPSAEDSRSEDYAHILLKQGQFELAILQENGAA